jgi:hypothetical protein
VDDVVRDPVAFVLAAQELPGELRALRVLGQELAEQRPGALHVAAGLLQQVEHDAVPRAAEKSHRRYGTCAFVPCGRGSQADHSPFTAL